MVNDRSGNGSKSATGKRHATPQLQVAIKSRPSILRAESGIEKRAKS